MRIDMHAHYIPPKALTAIEQDASSYGIHLEKVASGATCACFNYGLTLRPFQSRLFDLDERWDEMARMGVDRQLLSGWTDVFGYGMPVAEGVRWHRLLNETLGETVPSAYLRRFFYDTILYHPAAIKFLRDLVGTDRLLLGTDYPFPVVEQDPVRFLQDAGFSPEDVEQIGGERSRQLFKL